MPPRWRTGGNRSRAEGVQATKTCATITGRRRPALAQVGAIVKGALQMIAPKNYRERYRERSGGDPLIGPPCQHERGVWQSWPPKYGGVGRTRGQPKGTLGVGRKQWRRREKSAMHPLAPLPSRLFIVVRSGGQHCWGMQRSWRGGWAWLNSRRRMIRGVCPRWAVLGVVVRPGSTSSKTYSPPAGR
jgi:hypothetical protein